MHQTRRVLVRVRNPNGKGKQWVEVDPKVARLLREPMPQSTEELLPPCELERAKPRPVPSPAQALEDYWGGPGMPWEGPRVKFLYFVGHPVPERVTEPCEGHERLPADTYCIRCDRCGREKAIPCPTALDLAARAEGRKVYAPAGGLKGGHG